MTLLSRHISLKTEVPGPRSREILARLKEAVPHTVNPLIPIVVDRAHGSLLTDVDGNTYIDLTGGVGVLNVGHTNDHVVAAVEHQIHQYLHTDFALIPYEPYVRLAERLGRRFPGSVPAKVMFFNSGAEAVENAVKIARAVTGRRAIIAFEGAFHGRTYMAMSLTSKPKPYKAKMGPLVPEIYRAPFPDPYRRPPGLDEDTYLRGVERLFETQVAPEEVAAVVVEPILGEGGFVVPPRGFLSYLRRLTETYGILLICDEVQTGFGRTGAFFACEHEGVVPDLITAAKSIADGLPLSAVLGKREIMDALDEGMLGGTFVGNPVALAAAHAVLDIFEAEDILGQARRQGEILKERLSPLVAEVASVGEVRGVGAMVGVEFVRDKATKEPAPEVVGRVIERCLRAGVLIMRAGIHGNVVRFLAPLTTPLDVLEEALDVVVAAIRAEG